MSPDHIRETLSAPLVSRDGGDFDLNPKRAETNRGQLKEAAVLVPIVYRAQQLSLLFTRRTETLSSHAGQISFPGGRVDSSDASPTQAALREAFEEVGIPGENVEVVGNLPRYQTGSGYNIQPVVGLVQPDFKLVPQPTEVAEVFELPLADLLNPANHRVEKRQWQDRDVHFYVIPVGERRIWGATAGIVVSLSRCLGLRS